MRIAQVIGTVTLNRAHPSFQGARLRLVVPLSLENIKGEQDPSADPIVAWDELGAGIGSRIAMSEGSEASQPFRPDIKPVDAYNAAILESIDA
jgi:ethanolamine utilization protein EutN